MTLEAQLADHHCWFAVDVAPGDPETTTWKRATRLHQGLWRESHGYPIGSHPHTGGTKARPVGSRLEVAFAERTGANFLTPTIRQAVKDRLAFPEPKQMLDARRLTADLLSSMPMCFNLFGECYGDTEYTNRLVAALWPDAPKGDWDVLFEHSPGRGRPDYLGNRSAFDVAFRLRTSHGDSSVIGVETKYHEHATRMKPPLPVRLARYEEVTEASGAFVEGWRDYILGTELEQIWLDHLLVLCMIQHPTDNCTWGRFVLVAPRGNPSFARAAGSYRAALRDQSTFEYRTIEDVLEAGVLRPDHEAAFCERYSFSAPGYYST
ncbi:MAG TPA: hypothetical protein VMR52_01595 [Dehalococcoidia bacterium]|nr:hypothetical protein [Dehalococcoidia bacterium]